MSWIQKVLGIEANNKLVEAMASQMTALTTLITQTATQSKQPTPKGPSTAELALQQQLQQAKDDLAAANGQLEAMRQYRAQGNDPEVAILKAENARLHQNLAKAWSAANAMADPDTAAAAFAKIIAQEAESRGSGQRFHLELDSDVSRGIEVVKAAGLLSRPLSRIVNDLLRGWLHGQYRDMAARIAAQGVAQGNDQECRI